MAKIRKKTIICDFENKNSLVIIFIKNSVIIVIIRIIMRYIILYNYIFVIYPTFY